MPVPSLTQLCDSVAAAARRLAASGLFIGTAGNLSARVGDLVALTATGAVLAQTTSEEVTVVELDGRIVHGDLLPTSESALHLGLYRTRPIDEVGSIVHTHSRMATTLSVVLDEVPVVHYQQLLLGGSLRVAPFHPFGSAELADAVRAALDGRQAALMANHGCIALGASLEQAVENALLTEWCAELYWSARAIGEPRVLSAAQQEAVIQQSSRTGYGITHKVQP